MGTKSGKRGRDGVLSVRIDPLLLEGGRTVREIAVLLVPEFTGTHTVASIINNIRSRMVILEKQGYKLEKASDKKLRFVKEEVPAEDATSASVSG